MSPRLQTSADSDKIQYILSKIYLPQSNMNVFHVTRITRHYKLTLTLPCET